MRSTAFAWSLGFLAAWCALPAQAAEDVRVIVSFHGRADAAAVRAHGGTPVGEIASSRAVVARVPLAAVARLRSDASVAFVELDGEAVAVGKPSAPVVQPPQYFPWGILRVDASHAWGYTTGAGASVAVIDTGIDNAHPDLAAHVILGPNFVSAGKPSRDDNGHGTHVAGTVGALNNAIGVVGVGPDITLHAVKVLDRRGSGWWSSVAGGIDWAAANGISVASMSLGGGYAQVLEIACQNAEAQGVLLVAAAGNSGNAAPGGSTVGYPAAFPSVVAVSAIDNLDRIASFSSTGPDVEIAAPGVYVNSTAKGGGYTTMSGTSMATPHVSGVGALVLSRGLTDANGNGRVNDEARALLAATAQDRGSPGRDAIYGYGIVDALAAVANAR